MRDRTMAGRLKRSTEENARLRMALRLVQMKCEALEQKLKRWGRPTEEARRQRNGNQQSLPDLIDTPQLARARRIQELVAKEFGITREHMLEKIKSEKFCIPRWVAMKLINELLGIENGEMGYLFFQSRTNWFHCLKSLNNRLETEPALALRFGTLKQNVQECLNGH